MARISMDILESGLNQQMINGEITGTKMNDDDINYEISFTDHI